MDNTDNIDIDQFDDHIVVCFQNKPNAKRHITQYILLASNILKNIGSSDNGITSGTGRMIDINTPIYHTISLLYPQVSAAYFLFTKAEFEMMIIPYNEQIQFFIEGRKVRRLYDQIQILIDHAD